MDGVCEIDAFSCEDDCSKCGYYNEFITIEVKLKKEDIPKVMEFLKTL